MRKVINALWVLLVLVLMVFVVNYASNESMIKAYNNGIYEKNNLAVLGFTEPYISHYNQGNNYFQQGYYDLAIEEYEKALDYSMPEETECMVRINKVLAITAPIDKKKITVHNLMDNIAILREAEEVLTENGCADEKGKGHNKDAQQLYDDIEEFIDELGVVVKFVKTDEEGRKLSGATIQILDEEGKVMYEYETSDTPYLEKGFRIGRTYTMKETKAPQGYATADDVVFTINKDGSVTYENKDKKSDYNEVVMIDKKDDSTSEPQPQPDPSDPTDPTDPTDPSGPDVPVAPYDPTINVGDRPNITVTPYEYYDGEPW